MTAAIISFPENAAVQARHRRLVEAEDRAAWLRREREAHAPAPVDPMAAVRALAAVGELDGT